jgi:signal transduction histidine kinase
VFQVEINRRLGSLLRVAGIDLKIVPHETEQDGGNYATPAKLRLSAQFTDGDHDLLFTFRLANLSKRSRQGIYDTATTVLTDYLKVISLTEPAAPQLFQYESGEKINQRLLSDVKTPTSELPSDNSITTRIINTIPADYMPPYNATGFAHRLRNLLSTIMSGSSQLASTGRSQLDPDDLLLLKTIRNASIMQGELISRYLMAYGPLRLTLRPLDLGVALHSALDWHYSECGRRTEITSEGNQTEVISDSEILRQIIIEVLRNAHEDSDGKTVTLRWCVTDRQALIMIKNAGQVKGADIDNIFDQAFRTTKSGHAGLGLCIARRYAGYLGGTIKGLSMYGYTIVTICLPLVRNENILPDRERESQCPPY